MKSIRGVVFDIDGTLVNSNDAHARAWVEAFEEFGIEAEFGVVRKLIGKGGDKLMPEVSGIEKDSPEGKRIGERRAEIFRERYLGALEPTRGATALLEALAARGVKMVVATSAQEDESKALMAVADAERFMVDATTSSDARHSKPDPDIVEAALATLGVAKGEVIMVGDTPYDIEAASRSGIRTVALRSGGFSDADLAGAVAIFDDPAALARSLDDLPLGD